MNRAFCDATRPDEASFFRAKIQLRPVSVSLCHLGGARGGGNAGGIFNAGFLPSSRNLDRFYLCRQMRVNLGAFKPSSENRRILRKGAGIERELVPRDKFDYTPERRQFYKTYADIKFGKDVMTFERLDSLFALAGHLASAGVHGRGDGRGSGRGHALSGRARRWPIITTPFTT